MEASTSPATYVDVLKTVTGKMITVVNPESVEDAPTGYQLIRGFYRAKVLTVAEDYVTIVVEFVRRRGEKGKEPVKQYLPVHKIKRLTVSKSEIFLHI